MGNPKLLARTERSLEFAISLICIALAIAAIVGGGWRYAFSFTVLAVSLTIPPKTWKLLTFGGGLRYLVILLSVLSLSA